MPAPSATHIPSSPIRVASIDYTFHRPTVGREEDTMDPLVVAAVACWPSPAVPYSDFVARGMFASRR